jgi:hypothetical protein
MYLWTSKRLFSNKLRDLRMSYFSAPVLSIRGLAVTTFDQVTGARFIGGCSPTALADRNAHLEVLPALRALRAIRQGLHNVGAVAVRQKS